MKNNFVKKEPTPRHKISNIEQWAKWLSTDNNSLWETDRESIYRQGIRFAGMPEEVNIDEFYIILAIVRAEDLSLHPEMNKYINPEDIDVTKENIARVGGYQEFVGAIKKRVAERWPDYKNISDYMEIGVTMRELLNARETEKLNQ